MRSTGKWLILVLALWRPQQGHASPPAEPSGASQQTTLASAAATPKAPASKAAPATAAPATPSPASPAPKPPDQAKTPQPLSRELRAGAQRAAEDKLASQDAAVVAQGLDALAELGGDPAA